MGRDPRVLGLRALVAVVLLFFAAPVRAPDTTPPTVSWQFLDYWFMVGVPITLRANVQDGTAVADVWLNETQPDGSSVNITMPLTWPFPGGGYHELERNWSLAGPYAFRIWASDTSGNWGSANGTLTVLPRDTTPPTITNVVAYPAVQAVGGDVTLSATVTDDFLIGAPSFNVRLPDGTNTPCFPYGYPGMYWCTHFWNQVGLYTFTVTAADIPAGNVASASGSFRIVGPSDTSPPTIANVAVSPPTQVAGGSVTVSATITDDVAVSAATVDITRPDATHANVTMGAIGDTYAAAARWTQVGAYAFTIWAFDVTGLWTTAGGSFAITAGDTTPPSILHAPPPAVYTDDPIRIDGIVTDNIAVTEVRLVYTPVGGTEVNVTMVLAGGVYEATIPGQSSAGTVRYRVYAVDASGNAALSAEYAVEVRSRPTATPASLDVGLLLLPVALVAGIVSAGVAGLIVLIGTRGRRPGGKEEPPESNGTS